MQMMQSTRLLGRVLWIRCVQESESESVIKRRKKKEKKKKKKKHKKHKKDKKHKKHKKNNVDSDSAGHQSDQVTARLC